MYIRRRFCVFYTCIWKISAQAPTHSPTCGVHSRWVWRHRCALFSLNALIQFSLPLWCAFVSIYIYMYSCLSHGSQCTKAKFSACIRCTCTYSNTHCGTSEKCIYIYHFYSFLLRQVYAELLILRMKPLGASLWFSFVFAWFAFKITFLKIN